MAKILCVDDDPMIRKMIGDYLSKKGYELHLAENGKLAIEFYKKEAPDIVICDILMPDMSGIEVLKSVKRISSTTEVIIITGDDSIDTSINALREGAYDYFKKPIDFKRLNNSIVKALERQETKKQLIEYNKDLEKTVAEKMQEIVLRKELEKDLVNRINIETVVSEISAKFIDMNLDNLDKELEGALLQIGQTTMVDRMFFYTVSQDEKSFDFKYGWNNENIKQRAKTRKISFQTFPWFEKKIRSLDEVSVSDLQEVPEEGNGDRSNFIEDGIKSTISVPVKYGDNLVGFIGFDSVTNSRNWIDTDIRILNIVASIFVNAIEHRNAIDISLKQREKLIQADKMASVGTMAAGVAHEINNPLSVAVGDTHILKRDLKSLKNLLDMYSKGTVSDEIKKFEKEEDIPYVLENLDKKISRMEGAMGRIQGIVKSMKEFSHLDSKDVTHIDLNHHIENTLQFIPKKYKHDIEIVLNFQTLPNISCKGRQINQVLMNIIVNALQAMGDKGTLVIETGVEGYHVYVKISDTGPGVPEDKLKSIFDPFFTTKSVGEGTGLGLSISYSIIKEHKGEILVVNNLGGGATFTIKLPKH